MCPIFINLLIQKKSRLAATGGTGRFGQGEDDLLDLRPGPPSGRGGAGAGRFGGLFDPVDRFPIQVKVLIFFNSQIG